MYAKLFQTLSGRFFCQYGSAVVIVLRLWTITFMVWEIHVQFCLNIQIFTGVWIIKSNCQDHYHLKTWKMVQKWNPASNWMFNRIYSRCYIEIMLKPLIIHLFVNFVLTSTWISRTGKNSLVLKKSDERIALNWRLYD